MVPLADGRSYQVFRTLERTFKAKEQRQILWTDGCATVREALIQASSAGAAKLGDPRFSRSLDDAEAVIAEHSVWPA